MDPNRLVGTTSSAQLARAQSIGGVSPANSSSNAVRVIKKDSLPTAQAQAVMRIDALAAMQMFGRTSAVVNSLTGPHAALVLQVTRDDYQQLQKGIEALAALTAFRFRDAQNSEPFDLDKIISTNKPPPGAFREKRKWNMSAKALLDIFYRLRDFLITNHQVTGQQLWTCWEDLDVIDKKNDSEITINFNKRHVNIHELVLLALQNPFDPQVENTKRLMPKTYLDLFNELFDRKSAEIVEIARRELAEEVDRETEKLERQAEQRASKQAAELNARLRGDHESLFQTRNIKKPSEKQIEVATLAVSINSRTSSDREGIWKLVGAETSESPQGIHAFLTQRYDLFQLLDRVRRWVGVTPSQIEEFTDKDDLGQPIQRYAGMQNANRPDQIMRHDIGGLVTLLANERFRRQYLIETPSGYFLKARCCTLASAKDLGQMPWGIASIGISERRSIYHFFAEPGAETAPAVSSLAGAAAAANGAPERVRIDELGCAVSLIGKVIRIMRLRPEGVTSILEIAPK